ncbi:transcription elongation factor spt4 [Emergomyces africanus]|uniref:Transcription elongation factor SPT4 n=1 Tax=Emergomyces africanus TaxID=1955775 RepID=A0A1B7P2Q4_9EURO|nr:transcription elongation factor spt4 [Emergomyces africanus]
MASFYVPSGQQRSLRACMVCSIVQVHGKFMREGCPNCDHILGLAGNGEKIQQCTSQVFEGLITLADQRASWVARWQRLEGYVPGTYAVKVTGTVSTLPTLDI